MLGRLGPAAFVAAAVFAADARADEPLPATPVRPDATIFESSARVRNTWTEIASRGDRPKAWDNILSEEFRASVRVLDGLFEGKVEIGVSSDHFDHFSNANNDALRGEIQLGLNTGASTYLVEWKTRDVFEPGYSDFLVGLNTYDARMRHRFALNLFDDMPSGLLQASVAAGYTASTPRLFARYFTEFELEMVQRFGDGFALTLTPKVELSDYLDFPGGDRDDLVFSFRVIPAYNFGGGLTLSLEGQATVALSTRDAKTGETWDLTPILRFQKEL